eukprot:626747-Rhodomonas_salina.1
MNVHERGGGQFADVPVLVAGREGEERRREQGKRELVIKMEGKKGLEFMERRRGSLRGTF